MTSLYRGPLYRASTVLLGILDEGVPNPISDQIMSFFTPVFRPGL